MAHECANDDPHASEYAGKGSPNDSDNDEGLNVEPNANVTKLLTTQGSRDSNESTNADVKTISAMDTLEHMINTLRVRKENGSLTNEESNRSSREEGTRTQTLSPTNPESRSSRPRKNKNQVSLYTIGTVALKLLKNERA